jgi:hypothetical protein
LWCTKWTGSLRYSQNGATVLRMVGFGCEGRFQRKIYCNQLLLIQGTSSLNKFMLRNFSRQFRWQHTGFSTKTGNVACNKIWRHFPANIVGVEKQ